MPDDAPALDAALRDAAATCDLVVVSAGLVGRGTGRDRSRGQRPGPPGIFCHGLAIRPGKPTLLAECGGVPLIGLPGHPLSALVVFRLVGLPVLRRLGGCARRRRSRVSGPASRGRSRRPPGASTSCRCACVGTSVDAEPILGHSALLSVLAAADGYVVVPEAGHGPRRRNRGEVTLYR